MDSIITTIIAGAINGLFSVICILITFYLKENRVKPLEESKEIVTTKVYPIDSMQPSKVSREITTKTKKYSNHNKAKPSSASRKDSGKAKNQRWQLWKKILIIGAIAVIVMDVGVIYSVANPQVIPKPFVKITYPTYGSNVSVTEVVQGTSLNIPEGQMIWIAVSVPNLNRYYPMAHAALIEWNGEWSSQTTLGRVNDTGQFDIIAMTVNQDGQNEINSYLANSVDHVTNYYPGMSQLPGGTTVYDLVRVTRNP
jgi:hypothetical protein